MAVEPLNLGFFVWFLILSILIHLCRMHTWLACIFFQMKTNCCQKDIVILVRLQFGSSVHGIVS